MMLRKAMPRAPLPPVITIDGPSASGKGTVAQGVAMALGFQLLDSGALYRLTALAARRKKVSLDDADAVAAVAATLPARFADGRVFLEGEDVTDALRQEAIGSAASKVAAYPGVRAALLDRQRAFRQPPGLVADGRDMGTAVFPDATLKVFLTASVEARAERRYKQLIEKGFSANLPALLQDLRERDARDSQRSASPMKPAEDAVSLDSSALSIDQTVEQVLEWAAARGVPLR
jgi:cytidylate kinase